MHASNMMKLSFTAPILCPFLKEVFLPAMEESATQLSDAGYPKAIEIKSGILRSGGIGM